jgi:3-hydroxyisobutyrate dehydrogenase-like beta-hydroxyacid dehydrogenase
VNDGIRRIGVIGLGRMGSAIAHNLLRAGFKVTVYNRTSDKAQPLVAAGAREAANAREAARDADAVVTSLTDDAAVLEMTEGADGILAGLSLGALHVGTSTISPRLANKLGAIHAEHGSFYVAAPVAGRPEAAEEGKLLTFVAGEHAAIERCRPLVDAYCQRVIVVGERPELANSLKLAVNYVVLVIQDLMGQVYAFGEKSDLDLNLLNQLLGSFFAQPALVEYATRIRSRDFDTVGFDLRSGFKDVSLMLQAAAAVRAPLPFATSSHDRFITALAQGLGDKDWSAIYEINRQNAGLT